MSRRAVIVMGAPVLLGSSVAGLTQYLYQVVGARVLGSDAFAPVAVLWTLQYLLFAVFYFPLEMLIARTVLRDGGASVRPQLAGAGLYVGLTAAVAGSASWAFSDVLFRGEDVLVGVVVLSAVTYGSYCIVRGCLSGLGRHTEYAWLTGGESSLRLILALAIALVGATTVSFAITVPAGAALLLLVGLARSRHRWSRTLPLGADGARFVAGGVAAGLGAQALLAGGPLLLPTMGASSREISVAFMTLMVVRAPLVIGFSGLLSRLQPVFEAQAATGALLRRLTSWMLKTIFAIVLVSAAALATGPAAMQAIFGVAYRPTAHFFGLCTAAALLALANLLLNQMLVAHDRENRLAAPWVVATLAAVVLAITLPLNPLTALGCAFLAGELVAAACLLVTLQGAGGRTPAQQRLADEPYC